MKKKIILFAIGVLSLGMIGCTSDKQPTSQNNTNRNPVKVVEFTNKEEINKEEINKKEEENKIDEKAQQEALQKNIEHNNIVHARLISDMKAKFPNIIKMYIVDTEEGKTMNITIPIENNKDATIRRCAEITTVKETMMKNEGITNINIKIDNNNEHAGFIFFALRSGTYEPTLNTLK